MKYKQIKGYEGLYKIGMNGQVISLYFGKRKIMRQGLMTSGYRFVSLKKDGKQKLFSIHRLLAIHFIINPLGLPQVNHKNGNKLDNRLKNLEWVTQAQNNKHAYDTGLKKYRPLHYKGKFGKEHNRSMGVKCVETGIVYGSQSEAQRKLKLGNGSVSWSIKHKKPIYGMHFEISS